MLQIIIIKNPGEEDEQHCEVNLFSNTQITIVWENPLFLYDSISAMFSLSIELPATMENLVHFNYPNRIAALGVVEKFPAMIRHSGLMIARGELVLHMFSENIHGQFIGSVEISKRPLTELDMSEVEFSDIDVYGVTSFGHSPNEPDYSQLKWAEYKSEALAASDYSPGMTYCHAPVKKKYVPWDGHEALFGVKNSLLQYINFYNAREKKYHLVNENTIHTPVVPFFSVAYVIDKIFGDSLTENPFSQGDLAHLFFVSPGHPNYKNELYHTSISNLIPPVFMEWYESITIREFLLPVSENTLFGLLSIIGTEVAWQFNRFMHDYPVNETVKGLLKIFGISLFRVNGKFVMEFNNDLFDDQDCVSLDEFIDGETTVIREKPSDYNFQFEGERSSFEKSYTEYDTWHDVFLAANDSQPNIEFFYKTKDSPQVLSITRILRGLTSQTWLDVKIVQTALGSTPQSSYEKSIDVSSSIKPLNLSIEHYWWQNHNFLAPDPEDPSNILYGTPGDLLLKGHWHVPVLEQVPDKNSAPYIMLFAGIKPTISTALEPITQTLKVPHMMWVERDPGNTSRLLITFSDQNEFEQSDDPFSVGYIVEWRVLPDEKFYHLATLEPGIDWDPLIGDVSTYLHDNIHQWKHPGGVVNDDNIRIRCWAFEYESKSDVVYADVESIPFTAEENTSFNGDEHPYLTNHHTDHLGNRIFDFSLIPDSPDSFLEIYHDRIKKWANEDKIRVNANFLLSPVELSKIDMRKKVILSGRKFFIEKLQFTLTNTHIGPVETSLVSCGYTIIEEEEEE